MRPVALCLLALVACGDEYDGERLFTGWRVKGADRHDADAILALHAVEASRQFGVDAFDLYEREPLSVVFTEEQIGPGYLGAYYGASIAVLMPWTCLGYSAFGHELTHALQDRMGDGIDYEHEAPAYWALGGIAHHAHQAAVGALCGATAQALTEWSADIPCGIEVR